MYDLYYIPISAPLILVRGRFARERSSPAPFLSISFSGYNMNIPELNFLEYSYQVPTLIVPISCLDDV